MTHNNRYPSILDFWFGTQVFDERTYSERSALWFDACPAIDAEISRRFEQTLQHAAGGVLNHWRVHAKSVLAWIVMVDQFPRHIYRGTAQAYGFGELGLQWCRRALADGVEDELSPVERVFLYLPLQHTESMSAQRRCVERFEALVASTPATDWFYEHARRGLEMAIIHARIIHRYGRFPHRNMVLGRTPSLAEKMYLDAGGSWFGQRAEKRGRPAV